MRGSGSPRLPARRRGTGRDQGNDPAKRLLTEQKGLVTPDHVLVEVWVPFRHRLHGAVAERFREVLRSGVAIVEPVTPADLAVA